MKTAETLGGFSGFSMAPQVGLEPTTLRLTARLIHLSTWKRHLFRTIASSVVTLFKAMYRIMF